jgi:hypothetical protein
MAGFSGHLYLTSGTKRTSFHPIFADRRGGIAWA